MQCANCQFENMPGVDACGRCGASLRLASAAVDVHPPRAGRWAKRVRRTVPWLSLQWHNIRRPASPGIDWSWINVHLDVSLPAILIRMIVPGWPQLFLHRPRRARVFFFGWLAALFLTFLLAGTFFGSAMFGIALSLHAASILDVLLDPRALSTQRTAFWALVCPAFLAFAIYLPIGRLIGMVATPQVILINSPPFVAGDVILYNPSAFRNSRPQPGDVVLCNPQAIRIPLPVPAHMAIERQGLQIERLLAGPGSKVEWADGRLTVDDQPAEWMPLTVEAMPEKFSIVVPADSYLLVPPPLAYRDIDNRFITAGGLAFRAPATVTRNAILGRVYFRSQPFWRMGRIH
jgi:hypothetical protein